MYRSLRNFTVPTTRAFSQSVTVRARRTVQEIRQSRSQASPDEETTPEELQRLLERESDRSFGPNIVGDPIAYVNQVADGVWKDLLKTSGNDPRVFEAWREDLKARAAIISENPPNSAKASKRGPRG